MLKVDRIETCGWEAAIRGMRNPKNSWDKSDSLKEQDWLSPRYSSFHIGENDLKLMATLADAGQVHGKFLRMIVVTMDITAPLYWWAEFDTYKVGTVRNSCSKMHKLLAKPFEMSDFSFDKLPGYKNEVRQFCPDTDEEKETWFKCLIDPAYQVSDFGRIRHNGRILSCSLHRDGYLWVTIEGKQIPVHRLVANYFIERPEGKDEVNHKDGNKQNNQAANLEWVTRSENQLHAIQNDLQPKPVSTYKGKFSQEERDTIKALWDSGESKRLIARKYGVSHTCICDIVNDKYKYADRVNLYEKVARPCVDMLNELRDSFLFCEDEETKKRIWYSIIQLLPESYNQRSTVLLNYAVLKNIYEYRKDHKLEEWHVFCDMIRSLPYAKELIIGTKE